MVRGSQASVGGKTGKTRRVVSLGVRREVGREHAASEGFVRHPGEVSV